MITLVYTEEGVSLSDFDIWDWCQSMLNKFADGDATLLISQIEIFTVMRASACAMGKPEQVRLSIDGEITPVNKYGAYHGPYPEPPGSKASFEVLQYAMRICKVEMAQPMTLISIEDWEILNERILDLMAVDRKIDAIEYLRGKVDMGLKEAKEYVESIFEGYVKENYSKA